jgi:hypothetical protein
MAKKNNSKGMRFELAPQEKQKLVEPIQDIFLKRVLGFEDALITDESLLRDFFPFSKDKAIRKGKTKTKMVFSIRQYIGPKINPNDEHWRQERKKEKNWVTKEIEAEPQSSVDEVIEKTKAVFGVDISDICQKPLVEILFHIAMTYKRRDQT